MADGSTTSANSRITAIVQAMLLRRPTAGVVDLQQDLRTAGLTSLDMVNLMLAVEDEFEIEIPQDAMTPDNFRTIKAIDALVATLAAAG